MPLDTYRFGIDLQTTTDGAAAHGISPAGALLVRSDGFVAWRASNAPGDAAAELHHALHAVLGRDH